MWFEGCMFIMTRVFIPHLQIVRLTCETTKLIKNARSPNLLICILTFWQNKLNMNNFILSSNELKFYITISVSDYHILHLSWNSKLFLWFIVFFSKKSYNDHCTVQTVYQVYSLSCILSFNVCILSLTSKGTDKASTCI